MSHNDYEDSYHYYSEEDKYIEFEPNEKVDPSVISDVVAALNQETTDLTQT